MTIDWGDFLNVILRALLSLITLFLVTKLIGKKQVSQLSLFDYVIGISIGNFAAEMTINLDSHFLHGTVAVLVYGIVAYLISILTMKSIWLRRYFMGTPTVLVEDGVLLEGGLKKVKFDINDFLEECRVAGYFDISDIAYAIMEANGEISILPKSDATGVVRKDFKMKSREVGMCANLVIDGKIMKKNLQNYGKSEEWLLGELELQGKMVDDLLLVTADVMGNVVVYEKNGKVGNDVLE